MSGENPLWGASRIHGELLMLGFKALSYHDSPSDETHIASLRRWGESGHNQSWAGSTINMLGFDLRQGYALISLSLPKSSGNGFFIIAGSNSLFSRANSFSLGKNSSFCVASEASETVHVHVLLRDIP